MRFFIVNVVRKKSVLQKMKKVFASGKVFNKGPLFQLRSTTENEAIHSSYSMLLVIGFCSILTPPL